MWGSLTYNSAQLGFQEIFIANNLVAAVYLSRNGKGQECGLVKMKK